MEQERSAKITMDGQEYEMILTTRATKEIAKRYGGLEKLGDELLGAENFEVALDSVIWLVTILANQAILIHNLKNSGDQKELLTEEYVELMTSPLELSEYKEAIMEAMKKGTARNIKSEEEPSKNVSAR
jgi:hypothetical protein